MKAMVEYYYMWKTTDRYVQQVSVCCLTTYLPMVTCKHFVTGNFLVFSYMRNFSCCLFCRNASRLQSQRVS